MRQFIAQSHKSGKSIPGEEILQEFALFFTSVPSNIFTGNHFSLVTLHCLKFSICLTLFRHSLGNNEA